MTLEQTTKLMNSSDYKERFIAEYWQTKIRYERLKKFNTAIEAADVVNSQHIYRVMEVPAHDCPESMLKHQQHIMGEYLHTLELRAVIEGINLEEAK